MILKMVLNKFLSGCVIAIIAGFLVADNAQDLVWFSLGTVLAISALIAFFVVFLEGFFREPIQK